MIFVISGPTASGKSYVADILASSCDAVIINADSQQVYTELPILSAQPYLTKRHLLYSVMSLTEKCSVGVWVELARSSIKSALAAGKTPIVVGGTGLYIDALLYGLAELPDISPDIRHYVENLDQHTRYKLLELKDLKALERIKPNDSYRTIRALEVYEQTGQSITSFKHERKPVYENYRHICLLPDRQWLYKTCDERFEDMIENGAIEEVKNLDNITGPINTIGFNELLGYLNNSISLEVAKEQSKQATRNYAKRQYTWFRNKAQDAEIITFQSVQELKSQTSTFVP